MTSISKPRRKPHEKLLTPERLQALDEWTRKPMDARTEAVAAAVIGFLSFWLFFLVYMLSA